VVSCRYKDRDAETSLKSQSWKRCIQVSSMDDC